MARQFVESASFNILKNLRYYANRNRALQSQIEDITELRGLLSDAKNIEQLMGLEGNCRQMYYTAFEEIVEGYAWEGRRKRPPKNELNALVSFGNSMCYAVCLDAIYNSQLNPTISFLHEPGTRRYSLALDIAEIFKPILVDRTIFRLTNKKEIKPTHFEKGLNGVFLRTLAEKYLFASLKNALSKPSNTVV